nr:MAG TPA: hypothetical protein [Caudoviricetes sp.]
MPRSTISLVRSTFSISCIYFTPPFCFISLLLVYTISGFKVKP